MLLVLLLMPLAASAQSQTATTAVESEATQDASAEAPTAPHVTEFDTVRVTAPRPAYVDPFALRNPVQIEDNRFNRNYREQPSIEEIGMQGGIILLGINYGLMKAAEQVTRLPGWKHQVQPATARPSPLDHAQIERATRLQRQEQTGQQSTEQTARSPR